MATLPVAAPPVATPPVATLQELERRVSALEQAMVNVPGMQGGTLTIAAKEDLKKKFMKNSAKKQKTATVKPDAK